MHHASIADYRSLNSNFPRAREWRQGVNGALFALIFRDCPLPSHHHCDKKTTAKHSQERSIRFSCQISEINHSHENVWQLIFRYEGLEWSIAGQGAIQPLCHSLGCSNASPLQPARPHPSLRSIQHEPHRQCPARDLLMLHRRRRQYKLLHLTETSTPPSSYSSPLSRPTTNIHHNAS